MAAFREHLLEDMLSDPEKGLNKFFYRAREAAEPEQLEMFLRGFEDGLRRKRGKADFSVVY